MRHGWPGVICQRFGTSAAHSATAVNMSDNRAQHADTVVKDWPIRQRSAKGVGERHGWPLWINVTCVECPSCGYTFDADHEDVGRAGYTCGECGHQSEDGA